MKLMRMSALKDFETCPFLYKTLWGELGEPGRVELEESPTNKYAQYGIIFHEVMEQHALSMMEGHSLSLSRLHELLDEKLKDFDLSLLKEPEEHLEWTESLHEQLDWGCDNRCMAFTKVIGAEVKFQLDDLIKDMIPFTGTMDRIVGDLDKKEVYIEDWKTGKVYTKKELSNNIQATVYSLAFYRMFGFLPKEFRFIFTKHKKVKTVHITPDFLEKGIERILGNWYKIKNGECTPNTGNKYFCKNFCSINGECPTQKRVKKKGWELVG